jgi:AmmeMemoRadiSam system protein B
MLIFLTIIVKYGFADSEISDFEVLRSPYEEMVQAALNNHKSLSQAQEAEPIGRASAPAQTDGPETVAPAPNLIVGGIAPHHDLAIEMIINFYSALAENRSKVAKNRPTDLEDLKVNRVFLFSPDHFKKARNFLAACPSTWKLSTGELKADPEALKELIAGTFTELRPDLFKDEHGITIHIPFIAHFFPQAKVVPIVLRSDTPDIALLSIRHKLSKILQPGDLIILSMDLSHYKTPEAMALEDIKTLEVLTHLRSFQTRTIDADAHRAAALVLLLFDDLKAREVLVLDHKDSSNFLNEEVISGTSYATIVYSIEK